MFSDQMPTAPLVGSDAGLHRQSLRVECGDSLGVLSLMTSESVQCVVTSPPYWGLRDYGMPGQIGLEPTPEEFIEKLVAVFREVKRVLANDGTCWVNMGDCYAGGGNGGGGSFAKDGIRAAQPGSDKNVPARTGSRGVGGTIKAKDLVGQPWMLAFALRADGWYLRRDIIWHKPNPMPESVSDRPATAHEYLFLLSKSDRYYYDGDSIKEPCSASTHARVSQNLANQEGSHRANGGGKTNGPMRAVVAGSTRKIADLGQGRRVESYEAALSLQVTSRNKRSVWTIPSYGFSGAHFATFPPDLVKPCILAGSRAGDVVLDPFAGSGTTGQVALELGRSAVLIELNPEYVQLIKQRTEVTGGLPLAV